MILSPMEVVSEGGELRKSGEKRKIRKFSEISTALMSMKEREIKPDP